MVCVRVITQQHIVECNDLQFCGAGVMVLGSLRILGKGLSWFALLEEDESQQEMRIG